jgi:hypothetical protein
MAMFIDSTQYLIELGKPKTSTAMFIDSTQYLIELGKPKTQYSHVHR